MTLALYDIITMFDAHTSIHESVAKNGLVTALYSSESETTSNEKEKKWRKVTKHKRKPKRNNNQTEKRMKLKDITSQKKKTFR